MISKAEEIATSFHGQTRPLEKGKMGNSPQSRRDFCGPRNDCHCNKYMRNQIGVNYDTIHFLPH